MPCWPSSVPVRWRLILNGGDAAEQRLWSTSVADPVSGEHWAVRGIGLDGQLLLGQGTRITSWTRWGDSAGRNL